MINFSEIQEKARELLKEGTVKSVLGFEKDPDGFKSKPVFVYTAEDVSRLTWDPTCLHNLAQYVVEEKKIQNKAKEPDNRPIAMISKGCDARTINVLVSEHFFKREEVIILGVSCEATGVVDENKLEHEIGMQIAMDSEYGENGSIKITTAENEVLEYQPADVIAERCIECKYPYPVVYDEVYGDKAERNFPERFTALSALDNASGAEKWDFWKHHMDRCIRCFACRSVCPMCFCDECVVDSIKFAVNPGTSADEKADRPKWIERSPSTSENFGYHIIRAMHLAGRCTDCGECERVCPVNIPLRLLNNKLEKESFEMFDYEAGADATSPALVASFRDEDPNDFIR